MVVDDQAVVRFGIGKRLNRFPDCARFGTHGLANKGLKEFPIGGMRCDGSNTADCVFNYVLTRISRKMFCHAIKIPYQIVGLSHSRFTERKALELSYPAAVKFNRHV